MDKIKSKELGWRKREIVASVRKIITTRGIENLTIRAITDDLGITEGALYRHFDSKQEILSLMIDDIEATLLTTIRAAAQSTSDPIEKLHNIFQSHLSYAEKRKGVSFILINEALNLDNNILRHKMAQVIDTYLMEIRGILSECRSKGVIADTVHLQSASIAFFGLVQSLVTQWALNGYKRDVIQKHIEQIFSLYLHGVTNSIGATTPPASAAWTGPHHGKNVL